MSEPLEMKHRWSRLRGKSDATRTLSGRVHRRFSISIGDVMILDEAVDHRGSAVGGLAPSSGRYVITVYDDSDIPLGFASKHA